MNADDRLATVRSTYDLVAESYASLLPDAGFEAPVDRGMIEAFVTHVTEGSARSVVDAGCGSGRMTRLLASLGVDVSGIDVSGGMIDVARRSNPELSFEVGELAELPFADMQLGGVFAWYSIIHSAARGSPPDICRVLPRSGTRGPCNAQFPGRRGPPASLTRLRARRVDAGPALHTGVHHRTSGGRGLQRGRPDDPPGTDARNNAAGSSSRPPSRHRGIVRPQGHIGQPRRPMASPGGPHPAGNGGHPQRLADIVVP